MRPNPYSANSDRDEARAELYRRFSKQGLQRQRYRRFMRGLTRLVVMQLLAGAKRALDFSLACALLVLLSPLLMIVGLLFHLSGLGLQRTPRVGR